MKGATWRKDLLVQLGHGDGSFTHPFIHRKLLLSPHGSLWAEHCVLQEHKLFQLGSLSFRSSALRWRVDEAGRLGWQTESFWGWTKEFGLQPATPLLMAPKPKTSL